MTLHDSPLSILNQLSHLRGSCSLSSNESLKSRQLLEALSSRSTLSRWSKYHHISNNELYEFCLEFLSTHIQNNSHNHYSILLLRQKNAPSQEIYRKHYHLLIRLFHPDKTSSTPEYLSYRYEKCTHLITTAYNNIKQENKTYNSTNNKQPLQKKNTLKESYSQTKKILPIKNRKSVRKINLHLSLFFVFSVLSVFIYLFISKAEPVQFYKKTAIISKINISNNKEWIDSFPKSSIQHRQLHD